MSIAEGPLEAALDSVAVGIVVQDPAGRVLYANRVAAELTGYSSVEAMLRVPPGDLLRHIEITGDEGRRLSADQWPGQRALRGEPCPETRLYLRPVADGAGRAVMVKASPVFDQRRRVVAVIIALDEITDRRRQVDAQQLLIETVRMLASSLDHMTVLSHLARMSVASIADWCTINCVRPDGSIERVAVAHRDAEKEQLLAELQRSHPLNPTTMIGVPQVIRTGQPELHYDVPDALIEYFAPDAVYLRILRALGVAPCMVVPLVARGEILGAMTFAAPDSNYRYGSIDLELAQLLASQAAMAMYTGGLSNKTRHTARRLHALLDASRIFAEVSLDAHSILPAVTRHVAEALGDLCVVHLLDDDQERLIPAAFHHSSPDIRAAVHDWFTLSPLATPDGMLSRVVQTGIAISERLIDGRHDFPDLVTMHAAIVVPLRVRDHAIGTLSIWRDRRDEPYAAEDLVFLQDVADRTALAVENTRLHRQLVEQERRLRSLQHGSTTEIQFDLIEPLTRREREVLRLLVQGLTNREIASQLHLSPNTIKGHVEHIIAKFGASSRTDVAFRATMLDILGHGV